MNEPNHDLPSNRSYRIALTVALALFFATLTVTILVILISNAREDDREVEFGLTLTAILSQSEQLLTVDPLTPAPPFELGRFPFTLRADSPQYSAAETCEQQVAAGQILSQDGSPTDAVHVRVWGDYFSAQTLLTGELTSQPAGEWRITLEGTANRRLWLQVVVGDRYLSAPVEIVLNADDCQSNHVDVVFEQTGSLE